MKWTFGISFWGTADEISVEGPDLASALQKASEELSKVVEIELHEVSGETTAQKQQIIPCHYKASINIMPKDKSDRLGSSERVSRAIAEAAKILKG